MDKWFCRPMYLEKLSYSHFLEKESLSFDYVILIENYGVVSILIYTYVFFIKYNKFCFKSI